MKDTHVVDIDMTKDKSTELLVSDNLKKKDPHPMKWKGCSTLMEKRRSRCVDTGELSGKDRLSFIGAFCVPSVKKLVFVPLGILAC